MNLSNTFLPAITSALEEVFTSCGVEYETDSMENVETRLLRLPGRVTVVIGLIGALRGRLVFSFDREAWSHLALAMMGVDSTEVLRISMLSELTNMLAGSLIRHESLSDDLDITPPTLLVGDDMLLTGLEPPALLQPVRLGAGMMRIVVAASA